MENKFIQVGDTVSVNINNGHMTVSHEAEVLYIPTAAGDSWIFEDKRTGDVHYVSEGCTITKKNRQ